jgi:hypothetical protein
MIGSNMGRRKLLITCLVLISLVGAGVSGFWLWSSNRLQAGLADWSAEQRARGYQVDYQGPQMGGFPFRLTARIEQPKVAAPSGWRWQGPPLAGEATLWDPFTIDLSFPGRHVIARAKRKAEVTAAEARAQVLLSPGGRLRQATAALSDLTYSQKKIGKIAAETLRIQVRDLSGEEGGTGPGIGYDAEVTGVVLPKRARVPLDQRIERARLEAVLVGAIPRGPRREALHRWRAAGGKLEIQALTLVWGELSLNGQGTLVLDRELRPEGRITTRVRGLPKTLDRLAAAGAIKRNVAATIKFALLALAGAGGNGEMVVPVTLRDGSLYLGPVPLLRLSPVL